MDNALIPDPLAPPPGTAQPAPRSFLVEATATPADRKLAWGVVLVSVLIFAVLLPLAKVQLPPVPAFIAGYQSATLIIDGVTAVLLFAQFRVLGLRALLMLAAGYLFSALMAVVHELTFPGLFSPGGLLGATPQSTAWMYMFWHAGFPAMVIAYSRSKSQPLCDAACARAAIVRAAAVVVLVVIGVTLVSTAGASMLPAIMRGNRYTPLMLGVVGSVCGISALSLLMLWRSPTTTVLDLWLMVVNTAWMFDIGLAAVFNAGRYDVGFYAGRIYGLLAAVFVLGVLLVETTRHYGQLIQAHARDQQANRELQRLYAKAQELDQLKTSFFANMSHEIRTPMNAILGVTYLLKRAQPTPDQVDKLDKIILASRHLLSIINDILDFSKIESGALTLEQAVFPLSAVLDHTRSLIEDSAQAKGIRIELDYDDVPRWLIGDQTRLRQALLNYAGNALKFTDSGRIALRCKLIERRGDALWVRFEVEDTGIGIPADKIGSLFQAFHQVDASTTRKFGGTGLGLAITQKLAALMGGDVGVDSQPGRGSRFWFTARLREGQPQVEQAQARSDAEREIRLTHAGARVLLVEDDPINQEVARVLLSEAGLQVDVAADGSQALQKVRDSAYDLVLMDLQMPVMDGITATQQIRQLANRQQMPILALSANSYEQDRERCLRAGMNDFIAKPVDPIELFATLLKWLPKASQLSIPVLQASRPVAQPDPVLQSSLLAVAGLDLERGLASVRGDLGQYWLLLQEFVARHDLDMDLLRRQLERRQLDASIRIAHTLKGSAGALGLRQLQTDATRLEDALAAGGGAAAALIEPIDTQLQALRASVRQIASARPEQRAAADWEQVMRLFDTVEPLLQQGDFQSRQLLENNMPLLRASLSKVASSQLERAIADYDLVGALKLVRQLRADAQAQPGR